MSEENKTQNQHNVINVIKEVFYKNWTEEFLYDSINNDIITYQNFLKKILEQNEKLVSLGIKKNDTVCLFMRNSVDLSAFYFSGIISQVKVAPLDPTRGKKEVDEILAYLNPKIIITNDPTLDIPNSIQLANMENRGLNPTINELDVFNNLNTENDFLITFTSGSTGVPKGVIHSFGNLVNSAMAFNKKFSFNENNIFLHNLPMSYMAGILNLIILPFITQGKIVIADKFEITNLMKFWDIVIKNSVNTFWFTPTLIGLLLRFDRGIKGIEYCKSRQLVGCVGTAPLNSKIKNEFESKYNIKLYESYGLSETLFVSTNNPNSLPNGVGELLDGAKISFAEDEILINVPWMFKGYLNVKEEEFLKNNSFTSGDLGKIDNNFLEITGRKKDLIIKGGINISPKRIEDFLNDMKIFNENVILGFPDAILGEKIVCFVLRDDLRNKEKQANREIVEKLGREYRIDEFIEMIEIPKTLNGKIDKPKIREIYTKNYSNL